MDISLIGYGRMGHEIERVALSRGHRIVAKLDGPWDSLPPCDVAIEFTQPTSAKENITKAISQGVPVVSGTTGWLSEWEIVAQRVQESDGTLFYSSNFSISIFLFRQVVKQMAHLMLSHGQTFLLNKHTYII